MNNSFTKPEKGKNSPRVSNQMVFSLFITKKRKKEKRVFQVLSAFCILCHWSPDNWLCLGGSLLDVLRLSSGKRYGSKLSLPSQGTVRQRFADLKGHGKIEIVLKGKRFYSELWSPLATPHTRVPSPKTLERCGGVPCHGRLQAAVYGRDRGRFGRAVDVLPQSFTAPLNSSFTTKRDKLSLQLSG